MICEQLRNRIVRQRRRRTVQVETGVAARREIRQHSKHLPRSLRTVARDSRGSPVTIPCHCR